MNIKYNKIMGLVFIVVLGTVSFLRSDWPVQQLQKRPVVPVSLKAQEQAYNKIINHSYYYSNTLRALISVMLVEIQKYIDMSPQKHLYVETNYQPNHNNTIFSYLNTYYPDNIAYIKKNDTAVKALGFLRARFKEYVITWPAPNGFALFYNDYIGEMYRRINKSAYSGWSWDWSKAYLYKNPRIAIVYPGFYLQQFITPAYFEASSFRKGFYRQESKSSAHKQSTNQQSRGEYSRRQSSAGQFAQAQSQIESPWTVLGIPQGSSPQVIRKAYRKMMLKWHPDKNPGQFDLATRKTKEIVDAYQRLGGK